MRVKSIFSFRASLKNRILFFVFLLIIITAVFISISFLLHTWHAIGFEYYLIILSTYIILVTAYSYVFLSKVFASLEKISNIIEHGEKYKDIYGHLEFEEIKRIYEALESNESRRAKVSRKKDTYIKELEDQHDIKRREIEDMHSQLIQASKLAAIGELAAGIAHELNNPIAGILGYAQFMAEKMKKMADNNDHTALMFCKYTELIANESLRCKKIIHNLLKFSRASELSTSSVNVNVVLADAIDIVQYQGHLINIDFKKRFNEDIPLIKADAAQLQQVFLNMIINALKAIPKNKNGTIEIITECKKDKNSKYIVIKIIDNGCGIPKSNIPKIFNPFFTTRPVGEGTGLGLSVSYGIIKGHNGIIEVESEENVGTKFTITLPIIEG